MLRHYAHVGLELIVLIVNTRILLNLWALLYVLHAFASGAAGMFRNSPTFLRKSSRQAVHALIILMFSAGVNVFWGSLWQDTVDTFVDANGRLILPDGSQSNLALSLLASCESDSDSVQECFFAHNLHCVQSLRSWIREFFRIG